MIDRLKTNGKAIALVFMILSLIFIAVPADMGAQPSTHKVQRGDTLWSICEKYYGDATLWPKLWEMNPFVTNPHLLKPGDIITLIEKEDISKKKVAEAKPAKEAKPAPVIKGIDLGVLTIPSTMGYLSLTRVEPWGEITGSTKSGLGAEVGDKIFINFMNRPDVKPGDEFRVARPIPVRHPLTDRMLGEIINISGKVVVKEHLQRDYFLAEVTDVFIEFGVGAIILPLEPMSNCVQPMATDAKLYGNIVGAKNDRQIIGARSVVYLDAGFKDGIQRGQVFEIVRVSTIPYLNVRNKTLQENLDEVRSAVSKEQYLADLWTKIREGKKLYEFPLGKLMIVESRPFSSTAIVLTSSEQLFNGAFIRGFSWTETPEFLMNLPSCPVE
jgi:LysM repeat protein